MSYYRTTKNLTIEVFDDRPLSRDLHCQRGTHIDQLLCNLRKEVTNSVGTDRFICQVGKPIYEWHELLGDTFSGSVPPR